ncbi:hypothetical protein AG2_082 [Listeria phage vB_LmoM_AG20]|uniref:Uncharacterized protein n=3 Tax=Pecentumvirus TaxID=1857844 RepID=M4H0D7_9CAUD|nr:hypothetical protein AG2_082 [Listeria phage vB_LmoM_AG20]AFJ76018.1 hypothetical protein AG2_082 [Listeria phage vB_LmoM_AG20]QIG61026.1 hypothetical protein vBLivaVAfA18_102 [Listeria phage vB_Liva_VAfA18]
MKQSAQRPSLFNNPKQVMRSMARAIESDVIATGAQEASRIPNVEIKIMPKYLEVTEKRMEKNGVIDLKPYFAKSNKKKWNQEGNWYLVIPIRLKTRDMSRKLYDDLRKQSSPPVGSSTTIVSDFLYDRRRTSPSVPSINYNPKSNNVTKKRISNSRTTYTVYRTVTAKSPANSWIVNRDRVNEEDMSKTMLDRIDRLMKWKLKNL